MTILGRWNKSRCLFILSLVVPLGACDDGKKIFNNVTSYCHEGEVWDNKEGKCVPGAPSAPPQPSAQPAYCICALTDGLTVAYFDSKPANYGSKGPITVSTTGCKNTSLCMDPNTVYDSGTVTISNIKTWQIDDRFGVYGAFGFQQSGANQPRYSPVPPLRGLLLRFATGYTDAMRIAVGRPKDNSPATCRLECGPNNNPWCLRLEIGGQEQLGLIKLQKVGLSNPPVVKKSDILEMFGQVSDGCDRGDTVISGGYVENRGASTCAFSADLSMSRVTITLPEVLRGSYSTKNSSIETVFSEPTNRAKLEFSDKSLNDQWGGDIAAVSSEGSYMGFSVGTNSCVRLKIGP